MKKRNIAIAATLAVGMVLGGALAAQAATSGSVSITQGVGRFIGTYAYNADVPESTITGTSYTGTLRSTSSQKVSFKAQVQGYGFSGLKTVTNSSVSYSRVFWDGSAIYTTTSKAQVCEVQAILWTDVCTTKSFNR